jgi:hypothetical protein
MGWILKKQKGIKKMQKLYGESCFSKGNTFSTLSEYIKRETVTVY